MTQLAIDFTPSRREPRYKVGQLARLLTYLQRHSSITTLEASDNLRICRLSERIRELQRLGYQFDKKREGTGMGATVIRYRLK